MLEKRSPGASTRHCNALQLPSCCSWFVNPSAAPALRPPRCTAAQSRRQTWLARWRWARAPAPAVARRHERAASQHALQQPAWSDACKQASHLRAARRHDREEVQGARPPPPPHQGQQVAHGCQHLAAGQRLRLLQAARGQCATVSSTAVRALQTVAGSLHTRQASKPPSSVAPLHPPAPGHERGKHGGGGHLQALGPHHLLRHNRGPSMRVGVSSPGSSTRLPCDARCDNPPAAICHNSASARPPPCAPAPPPGWPPAGATPVASCPRTCGKSPGPGWARPSRHPRAAAPAPGRCARCAHPGSAAARSGPPWLLGLKCGEGGGC